MFIDEVELTVKAGDGGDGCISFRRERFLPRGGPDGGDGGKGGDVIIVGNENLADLSHLRYPRSRHAENGRPGEGNKKHGRDGKSLRLKVPCGTLVFDLDSGSLLCDITSHGQEAVIARGGKGGKGNVHFATPRNDTPYIAERGEPGEEKRVKFDLRLIADVAFVGLPNSGKSSLLSAITGAKPKIAQYPYTTQRPVLGVAEIDFFRIIFMELPAVGPYESKGYDKFLKHLFRPRVIVIILDGAAPFTGDVLTDYKTVFDKIKEYGAGKKILVVVNKMDMSEAFERLNKLRAEGVEPIGVTAKEKEGLERLTFAIKNALSEGGNAGG